MISILCRRKSSFLLMLAKKNCVFLKAVNSWLLFLRSTASREKGSAMSQNPLVKALCNPSFYPDRPDEVLLVQTHISWIFLAGKKVYKVKKPVDFGFLDFSTLKKRKFFCTWEAITAKDLNTLLNIIWESDSVFFTLEYVESNQVKTATVYSGAIPTALHRTDDANWIWKDVTINFIER